MESVLVGEPGCRGMAADLPARSNLLRIGDLSVSSSRLGSVALVSAGSETASRAGTSSVSSVEVATKRGSASRRALETAAWFRTAADLRAASSLLEATIEEGRERLITVGGEREDSGRSLLDDSG